MMISDPAWIHLTFEVGPTIYTNRLGLNSKFGSLNSGRRGWDCILDRDREIIETGWKKKKDHLHLLNHLPKRALTQSLDEVRAPAAAGQGKHGRPGVWVVLNADWLRVRQKHKCLFVPYHHPLDGGGGEAALLLLPPPTGTCVCYEALFPVRQV